MEVLNRGQLAEIAKVNIETLRYYERRGLIPPPPRSAANYRRYPLDTLQRVRFVKHAQDLGFSLEEIRDLLSLRARRGAGARDMKQRAKEKIDQINRRIQTLERMRAVLQHLVSQCSGRGPMEECPIVQAMDTGGAGGSGDGGKL